MFAKSLAGLLVCLFSQACLAQTITTQAIVWSTTKLTWDDFQEQGSFNHGADTHWMLLMKIPDTSFSAVPDSLLLPIKALFVPALSWVKPERRRSSYLLAHEQLHFDIVEWQARELRKELSELQLTATKWKREVEKRRRQTLSRIRKLQERYDEETNHSRNESAQARWISEVQEKLTSLDAFAATGIWLRICACK